MAFLRQNSQSKFMECILIVLQEGMASSDLIIQLLGLFTAESMAAATDAEKSSLLSALLAAATEPMGPVGSTVRAAAISRLTPALYGQLSEAGAVEALQVLCVFSSRKADIDLPVEVGGSRTHLCLLHP